MEVGNEQQSEEMAKKLSQCWYVSEDRLSYSLSFPTWSREISRKVKKWQKAIPVLVGREDRLSYLLSFPAWRLGRRRKVKKWLETIPVQVG